MSAKTPDSVKQEKMGSLRLLRLVFSATTLADGDTYTNTSLKGYVDHWFSPKNNPTTQASAGMHVAGPATGVWTFYPGEDAATGTLFILVRG